MLQAEDHGFHGDPSKYRNTVKPTQKKNWQVSAIFVSFIQVMRTWPMVGTVLDTWDTGMKKI